MPPSLSSIRKSPRIAELKVKQIKNKEALEFCDAILSMHQEELKEAKNQKLIASKNDNAVMPLNTDAFIRQPYNIITPHVSVPGTFTVSTTTFLNILNWEGKTTGSPYPGVLPPPTSTLGIRKPFDDFNDVLKKDQGIKGEAVTLVRNTADICKLSQSKDATVESHRQGKRMLQKRYQQMCFYCGKQIDTKNPDSISPTLINSQCDHIFPIASALISLKRDSNIIYNFQAVHKSCNGMASALSIDAIWNQIGTSKFTDLNKTDWCVFTLDGVPTTTEVNTQAWCRGYLSLLLSKLTLVSSEEQMYRKLIFEKVIRSYQTYKDEVRLLMQDDVVQGVQYLQALSTGGFQSFGSPGNNVELLSIKKLKGDEKKYEAFFLVNGKQKKQKFGAEGMSDYTIHKDIERRNRYISRHYKDLDTGDPTRAGYLSMFVLWNKPSFRKSVEDYKTRLKIYNQTGNFPRHIKNYSKKSSFGAIIPFDRTSLRVLPTDVQNIIQRDVSARDIQKNVRVFLQGKNKIIRILKNLGVQNYKRTGKKKFINNLLLNYDITTAKGVEITELADKLLTKDDFKNKSFWWNLVKIGLESMDVVYDDTNEFSGEELINVEKCEEILIDLVNRAGIPWDFTELEHDTAMDDLLLAWENLDTSSSFGKISNIPSNVIDVKLYKKVKDKIKKSIMGRRWGAYDSGRLVQMYKQLGGKYSGTKEETPLQRWYKEKWINACKWPQVVPCGRSDMTNKMAYCRPSVKVTKDTPKTVQSLTREQINKRCKIKEKTPLVIISRKLKV